MKKFNMYALVTMAALLAAGCEDPISPEAVPNTNASGYTANFLFVNAAPDAPSLDFFVNNLKTGESVTYGLSHEAYTTVPITSSPSTVFGTGGALTTNTNFRARATSGIIGTADEKDYSQAVYRAGNNNSNNFTAINSARYTLIALDSTSRPKPLRTLNGDNFADTTFFNPLTGSYIDVVEKAALSPEGKARLVAIGTVPLGSTDPGGVRFYLTRDIWPAFTVPNTTQAAIRVIHGSPTSKTLSVRLRETGSGAFVSLGDNLVYILNWQPVISSTSSTYSPAVGSRTVTPTSATSTVPPGASFTLRTTGGIANTYVIEVSTDNFASILYTSGDEKFEADKAYTVLLRGVPGSTGDREFGATVIQHN